MKGLLLLPGIQKVFALKVTDIVRLESKGAYTIVIARSGKPYLTCKHLKIVMSEIRSASFFRVHKSHVVNMKEIEMYERGRGGCLWMSDGSFVPVSQRKKAEFLRKLYNK